MLESDRDAFPEPPDGGCLRAVLCNGAIQHPPLLHHLLQKGLVPMNCRQTPLQAALFLLPPTAPKDLQGV